MRGRPVFKSTVLDPGMSDEFSAPMIDLRSMKDAARRRRKLWVSTALAGLVIGAAFHLFVPAKYAAVTDLYMVEPAGADPSQAMQNDVSLLETRSVAQQAIADLHLNFSPASFVSTYQGAPTSNSILSIKLNASTSADAVAYDNAIANAFLQVRAQQLSLQTALVTNGLQTLVNSLNADIKLLTSEVNALSSGPAQQQSANKIAELVNERTGDASQISQLQQQQQQDVLNEKAVAEGSRVLDPAVAVNKSAKKAIAMDGLSGLVAGLAIGLGIVVVGAAISERPRRRADVAAALGVPVEISVGKYHLPFFLRHLQLRRSLKRPGPTLQMIERRLSGYLGSAPGSSLAVVPIGPVEPAALGVASLTQSLVCEGKKVLVIDMADGRPLSWLLSGSKRFGAPKVLPTDEALTVLVAPTESQRQVV